MFVTRLLVIFSLPIVGEGIKYFQSALFLKIVPITLQITLVADT